MEWNTPYTVFVFGPDHLYKLWEFHSIADSAAGLLLLFEILASTRERIDIGRKSEWERKRVIEEARIILRIRLLLWRFMPIQEELDSWRRKGPPWDRLLGAPKAAAGGPSSWFLVSTRAASERGSKREPRGQRGFLYIRCRSPTSALSQDATEMQRYRE